MSLAVGQTLPFVMSVTQEWFLTLSTHKVLHMPMFAQSSHHSLLYGPPAGPTDGNAHLVMTPQAVELVEFIGGVSRPGPHLPRGCSELLLTASAGEVVGVVHLPSEP